MPVCLPLGAATGLLAALSPIYLKREAASCTACAVCTRTCPMGLPVHTATTIKNVDCIGCLECVDECPREGALALKLGVPVFGKCPGPCATPVAPGGRSH